MTKAAKPEPNQDTEVATVDTPVREPEVVTNEMDVIEERMLDDGQNLIEEVATSDVMRSEKDTSGGKVKKAGDKPGEEGKKPDAKGEEQEDEAKKPQHPRSAKARVAKAVAKKETAQREINRAVAEQRAAERRLAEIQAKNQQLQKKIEEAGGAATEDTELTKAIGKEPKYNDFEDDDTETAVDKYNRARDVWKEKKAQQQKADETKRATEEATRKFYDRVTEVRSIGEGIFEDYVAKVHADTVPWSPGLAAEIMRREDAPEIFYHLASDHNEIKRLAALSGEALRQEIEKVSQSVAEEEAPADDDETQPGDKPAELLEKSGSPATTRPASRAHQPITPIKTGGGRHNPAEAPQNPSEYRRWRQQGGGR